MMFAFMLLGGSVTSCLIPDDVEESGETYELPSEDTSFKPTLDFLQTAWIGEYTGYDESQYADTKIKRRLVLRSDGSYRNVIQGVIVSSGKSDFVDFEMEQGTYEYDIDEQCIVYKVKTDSLINYDTGEYERYTVKHSDKSDVASYTERTSFSAVIDGNRQWITRDTYLTSKSDKEMDILYIMIPQ